MMDIKDLVKEGLLVNAFDFFSEEEIADMELDKMLVEIGCILIKYRIKHDLSRRELAKQMGIGTNLLEMMENADYESNVALNEY